MTASCVPEVDVRVAFAMYVSIATSVGNPFEPAVNTNASSETVHSHGWRRDDSPIFTVINLFLRIINVFSWIHLFSRMKAVKTPCAVSIDAVKQRRSLQTL